MNFIAEYPIITIGVVTLIFMAIIFIIDKKLNDDLILDEQETLHNEPQERKEVKSVPSVSYNQLMEILDKTIDQEIYFWLKLTIDMQDVRIIDFNKSLDHISHRIDGALSDEFLSDLEYYHDERWLKEYIVRKVKIFLTEYIRKHPV